MKKIKPNMYIVEQHRQKRYKELELWRNSSLDKFKQQYANQLEEINTKLQKVKDHKIRLILTNNTKHINNLIFIEKNRLNKQLKIWSKDFDRWGMPDNGFQIDGYKGSYYLWNDEFNLIIKYAKIGKNFLEVGSYCGIVAAYLAEHLNIQITSVDAFIEGHATHGGLKKILLKNIKGLPIKLIEGMSQKILPTLSKHSFDIAFIDADHAYEAVLQDAKNCWNLVKPGGYILFHDYKQVEETTKAIHEVIKLFNSPGIEHAGSVVVIKRL